LYLDAITSRIAQQINIESKRVCLGEVGVNPTLSRNREKDFFQVGLPTTFIYPPVEDCGARILI
jgi:hypothetical protein